MHFKYNGNSLLLQLTDFLNLGIKSFLKLRMCITVEVVKKIFRKSSKQEEFYKMYKVYMFKFNADKAWGTAQKLLEQAVEKIMKITKKLVFCK